MRRSEDDDSLSFESILSDNNLVAALHSSHKDTACRPFIMDTSKLYLRQHLTIDHMSGSLALVAETRQGALNTRREKRLSDMTRCGNRTVPRREKHNVREGNGNSACRLRYPTDY